MHWKILPHSILLWLWLLCWKWSPERHWPGPKNLNQKWVLWGPIFPLTWLPCVWSCLVLMKNNQKYQAACSRRIQSANDQFGKTHFFDTLYNLPHEQTLRNVYNTNQPFLHLLWPWMPGKPDAPFHLIGKLTHRRLWKDSEIVVTTH